MVNNQWVIVRRETSENKTDRAKEKRKIISPLSFALFTFYFTCHFPLRKERRWLKNYEKA